MRQMVFVALTYVISMYGAASSAKQSDLIPWKNPSMKEGQTLVVQAWASWCASCSTILPKVHQLVSSMPSVTFATASIDDDADDARGYCRKNSEMFVKHDLSVFWDQAGKALLTYDVKTVPATLIFSGPNDRRPQIFYGFDGAALEKALARSH